MVVGGTKKERLYLAVFAAVDALLNTLCPYILRGAEMRFFIVAQELVPRTNPYVLSQVLKNVTLLNEVVEIARFRPPKVRRIYVRIETAMEAVQLIRPDKVHLASKGCVVTGIREVMTEGRMIAREWSAVVIDADVRDVSSGHHCRACWYADRTWRVRRVKSDALFSQDVKIRRFGVPVAVRSDKRSHQLICHD